MPRTLIWPLLSWQIVTLALSIILVLGRDADARRGVEQQAFEQQQQGLVQLDRNDATGSLHLFAEAYETGHRPESLVGMAASELRRSRFTSAQLLLLHPTVIDGQPTLETGWLGSVPPLTTLAAQARQGLRKVKLTLRTVFHVSRARLLVDCRLLLRLPEGKDGGPGKTPRLIPLPAELPYRSLPKQADSMARCPLAGQPAKETAAQVQVLVEHQRKLDQLEAAERDYLGGLMAEELPATEFLLLLDPGPHTIFLIDSEGEFVPFYQRLDALPESDQPVALALDLGQQSGVLQLRLIDEKTAADGERSGSEQTSGGLGKHELRLKVTDSRHQTLESRRLPATNLQLIELKLPPILAAPGYAISADLSGWDFFPVSKSEVTLQPGQVFKLDLVFRPRPLYRKWTFWTYLSIAAGALAAVVAGGIEGYRAANTLRCGVQCLGNGQGMSP